MKKIPHNLGRQVIKELNIAKFGSFSVLSVICAFMYRVPDSAAEDSTAEDSTAELYLTKTLRRSFS